MIQYQTDESDFNSVQKSLDRVALKPVPGTMAINQVVGGHVGRDIQGRDNCVSLENTWYEILLVEDEGTRK